MYFLSFLNLFHLYSFFNSSFFLFFFLLFLSRCLKSKSNRGSPQFDFSTDTGRPYESSRCLNPNKTSFSKMEKNRQSHSLKIISHQTYFQLFSRTFQIFSTPQNKKPFSQGFSLLRKLRGPEDDRGFHLRGTQCHTPKETCS